MTVVGFDFGTTNSLISVVVGDRVIDVVDPDDGLPFPSVVRYEGAKTLVGREAKESLDSIGVGVHGNTVMSPKFLLGDESVHVGGVERSPIDIVDGLAMTVLPMPYHMHATPVPRTRESDDRAACALNAATASRACRQPARNAVRHARRPTLASSRCPVGVVSPARNAWRSRYSSGSWPTLRAASSNRPSSSSVACGTPKPRKAPDTAPCVCTARVSARTCGTR